MKLVFEHGMYRMNIESINGDITICMKNVDGDETTMQIFPDEACALISFLGVILEVPNKDVEDPPNHTEE